VNKDKEVQENAL